CIDRSPYEEHEEDVPHGAARRSCEAGFDAGPFDRTGSCQREHSEGDTRQLGSSSPLRSIRSDAARQPHGGRTGGRKCAATQGAGRDKDGARYCKKSGSVLCAGVAAKYAWMKTVRLEFPVTMLCKALDVSRSGFYDWLHAKPSARAQEDARLKVLIKAAHRQSRETYGTR